jgi:hypothetical protein
MRLKALSNIKADGPTELKAGDVFEVEDVAGQALVANGAAVVTENKVTVEIKKLEETAPTVHVHFKSKSKSPKKSKE